MKHKIVDYRKLNKELLNLLTHKFPEGYSDKDIVAFRNAQNEFIEAVEIQTKDNKYLVKVGKRLIQAMEDFEEQEDDHNVEEDNVDIDALSDDELEDS